jgi:hypothetical protein
MEGSKKRKSPKDDEELGFRARVGYAATTDDIEEFGFDSKYQEGLGNEDLHKYVHKAINEVNKRKSKDPSKGRIHQAPLHNSYCEYYVFISRHIDSKTMCINELAPFFVNFLIKE